MKLNKLLQDFENSLKTDKELNEVSVATGAAEFIGGKGQTIDVLFAGPFHREFGDLHLLLKAQLDDYKATKKWNDDVTPELEKFFKAIDFDYQYDTIEALYDKIDFINKSETNMEYVGVLIDYDDNKPIYDKQHRDKDNFINKSSTNWKYIK